MYKITYIVVQANTHLFNLNDPDHPQALAEFVKGRPQQSVVAFDSQCDAVLSHDCEDQLKDIKAPALLTFGEIDSVTSVDLYADKLTGGIETRSFT